jgi:anthranilate synthase component 2
MLVIIDNYDSFTFNLYQAIASLYQNVQVIRNDRCTINDIKKMDLIGIILSPGPGRPESAGICIDLIRALLDKTLKNVPLLGVCLGHQALTVALGGRVIQANEIIHGKSDDIFHLNTGLYQSLTSPFKAGRYHSLIAERESLPDALLIEAENKEGMIMGIRHRDLPLYGVQFHPESMLTPEGEKILKNFTTICLQQEIKMRLDS